MVQEIRQITLGVDELRAAIEAYRRAVPEFLPAGIMIRCQAMSDGVVLVCIEIMRDGFIRPAEFILRGRDILRPVVNFCLQNGVALPNDGRTAIFVEADCVTLRITRNVEVVVPAWIVTARMDRIKSVTQLSPGDINPVESAAKSGT